ncbi:TetR/AcrR family transcriptional regulator [Virgibacillus soli]|uniref:TetR/AcrR family transcriptional regulator n=1 Tax=Paracerasibacillus soli TaxID=480284 RepID=A0ABU5CTI4_9BACI|nr:TetR/AcrR family transcriptional regulator [Virgibacillus soli]MDY0409687.1 TetR/AcrR family transcriptional regulator [Virgibacillus soli]
MPKQTFYNLPDDKKQILIQALEEEFSRAPLFHASISNIVKSADIPRGSFYQYFEGKEDAYFYLISRQVESSKKLFITCLMKYDGDLFHAVTELFKQIVEELSKGDHINFLKNVFLNMTHEIENKFTRIFNGNDSRGQFCKMNALINKDNLNVSNENELYHLVQIIGTITIRNLIEKIAQELSSETAMNNFHIELTLLKEGLYKRS